MISRLSSTRTEAIHDIASGLPTLHHGTCINMYAAYANPGDRVHLFTREGSYFLDTETLESEELYEYNGLYFAIQPNETIIKESYFAASSYSHMVKYQFCFSEKGNLYLKENSAGGASFGIPVNTTKAGMDPEFRVAPYMGYNWSRPWGDANAANVLFYDIDNLRFMLFVGGTNYGGGNGLQLEPIANPGEDESHLFSYNTGRNFVYMESTRRSNGLTYTILEDPSTGKRSIYGINMGGRKPIQELYIENVDAPDFDKATQFAFHSQYPIMFYSVGSKLYLYSLGTRTTTEMQTNLNGAEITKLKFNLYTMPVYTSLANQSEDFMNQQYRLVVGSYDNSNVNGGKVSIFDVDGLNYNISLREQYDGFAKVVDIVYRERKQ